MGYPCNWLESTSVALLNLRKISGEVIRQRSLCSRATRGGVQYASLKVSMSTAQQEPRLLTIRMTCRPDNTRLSHYNLTFSRGFLLNVFPLILRYCDCTTVCAKCANVCTFRTKFRRSFVRFHDVYAFPK